MRDFLKQLEGRHFINVEGKELVVHKVKIDQHGKTIFQARHVDAGFIYRYTLIMLINDVKEWLNE